MKAFKGPKFQGGWIGVAALVGGGILSSIGQQGQQSKQNKVNYQQQSDLSNLSFQQQAWLAQQQEAWNREDTATTHNYNKSLIAGFEPYAGANAASPDGTWQAPPANMVPNTSGLAQTQPNGMPLIIDPHTGLPMDANYAAASNDPQNLTTGPSGLPMTQFATG